MGLVTDWSVKQQQPAKYTEVDMTEDALYRPELWSLDPDVLHLNHGSFGACPSQILEQQTQLRQQMESNTLRVF